MSYTLPIVDQIAFVLQEARYLIEREHQFDDKRKFAFDIALPGVKVAVEYDGGIFGENTTDSPWEKVLASRGLMALKKKTKAGRHVRAEGFTRDCEKTNLAQINGWIVLRYTYLSIKRQGTKQVLADVRAAIHYRFCTEGSNVQNLVLPQNSNEKRR